MVSCRVTFELLPPEIREHILLFLDRRSLLSASCASKTWYRAISPVTIVWRRACQSLQLQVSEKDIIDRMMCRALFVRLVLRLSSIVEFRCLSTRALTYTPAEAVTAIYYYNEKLATGSQCGKIKLWTCPTFECKWISEKHSSWVTSIKFDDHIVLASYGNGSIASWNCLTGRLEKIYINPCVHTVTVDYLTAANLVVSAYSSVVAWNMTEGNLILEETLRGEIATKIVIKQYPPDEDSSPCPTVEKMLIASVVQEYWRFWLATSTGESSWRITPLRSVWRGVPQSRLLSAADELHFAGNFIFFTRYPIGGVWIRRGPIRGICMRRSPIGGVVCQWDVVQRRMVTEFHFPRDIHCLVGVGKKYIMVITTYEGRDQLEIMERQNSRIIISYPIVRYPWQILPSDFCLGERSWLDGFDGNNDSGAVCIFATHPNLVHVIQWSKRTDQLFLRSRYPNCLVSKPPRWDNRENTV